MSEIQAVTIGVNRYASTEANAVEVFSYNGCEGMTFGQLVMAVCCRRGALIENESVLVMNQVTATTSWLDALSSVTSQLLTATSLNDTADLGSSGYTRKRSSGTTLSDFLQNECSIDSQYLDVSTYEKRMALFDQVKNLIDDASRLSQEQTINLQSLISRRDVTYNTSAAVLRAIGQSMLNTAALY